MSSSSSAPYCKLGEANKGDEDLAYLIKCRGIYLEWREPLHNFHQSIPRCPSHKHLHLNQLLADRAKCSVTLLETHQTSFQVGYSTVVSWWWESDSKQLWALLVAAGIVEGPFQRDPAGGDGLADAALGWLQHLQEKAGTSIHTQTWREYLSSSGHGQT